MISNKLILFFWFYLLQYNSLGRETILQQGANKKLFMNAIDFGATYGGEVGKLGSQWKQLLFQLVQAKRKVGLAKYQLERFKDSATEEVDLAINATYADRVAELAAGQTQDIGTTQKYVDDLEILQNEIALTMIVKMEEIKEKFKETNVRKKVKEAKENGITDTDIKEILFADYFDSGLSLIGAAASSADALLSSFLNGMKSILDGTYYETLGIIQYGNILGSLPFGDGSDAGGDSDADDNDAGGDDVAQGGAPGGGPPGGGGAAGGGDPPGGGGNSPSGPPGGGDDDDSKEDDEKDDEDDDEKYRNDINLFFNQFLSASDHFNGECGFSPEQLANWHFNESDVKDDEEEAETDFEEPPACLPRFSARQLDNAIRLVNREMVARRARIQTLENDTNILARERLSGYFRNPLLQEPQNRNLNNEEKLELYRRRVIHLQTLLNTARLLSDDNVNFRYQFRDEYYLARDNYYFYGSYGGLCESLISPSRVPTSRPFRLPEFMHANEDYITWFLISREHLNALINIGNRLRLINIYLNGETLAIQRALNSEHAKII